MFRIGTTSYIIPDDILPNVAYLAPLVDDVELVLFEADEYGSNLPDDATLARLTDLGHEHDLTYTVHLPLDLLLGDGGEASHVSLRKAQRVIEATRLLNPYAYVLHLDGRALLEPAGGPALGRWQENAARALEVLYSRMEQPGLLCVENLEAWDPEAFAPIVAAHPVGRTIDVGHFWLQGMDPMAHLERWLDRTRVVHIHGIAARDHASLAHVPAAALDAVLDLLAGKFTGVLTIEVFNQDDLLSSLDVLGESLVRVGVQNAGAL